MRRAALSLFLALVLMGAGQPDSLNQRISGVGETAFIEVSSTDSDSAAYLKLLPDGRIVHVPWRSQAVSYPEGTTVTREPVIDFRRAHQELAAAAVLEKTWAGGNLVYFFQRGEGGATAVFIPPVHQALVEKIFEAYAGAPHVPMVGALFPEMNEVMKRNGVIIRPTP